MQPGSCKSQHDDKTNLLRKNHINSPTVRGVTRENPTGSKANKGVISFRSTGGAGEPQGLETDTIDETHVRAVGRYRDPGHRRKRNTPNMRNPSHAS